MRDARLEGAGERFADRLEVDPVEHVLEEPAHDQPLGLGAGEAPRHQVEELLPVDLAELGELGIETTRAAADDALAVALAHPERWGSGELHVEVETYTWSVLGEEARGAGTLVDGLERELRHVMNRLAAAGWRPAVARVDTSRGAQ